MTEYFPPLHAQLSDCAGSRRATINKEQLVMRTIGMQAGGQNAARRFTGLLLRFKNDGTGTVAEKNASRAVFPVEDAAERLRTDHQCPFRHARTEHRIGNAQRIEEPRTHRGNVKGNAAPAAQVALKARKSTRLNSSH